MPTPHWKERIDALLVEEINKLILKEVELPIGVMATVMGVDTDSEGEKAQVAISVYPITRASDALIIFKKMTGRLQYLLNRQLKMEYVPEIFFTLDYSNERASFTEELLEKISKEDPHE